MPASEFDKIGDAADVVREGFHVPAEALIQLVAFAGVPRALNDVSIVIDAASAPGNFVSLPSSPGSAEGPGRQPAAAAGKDSEALEGEKAEFEKGRKGVSLGDLIVLAGGAAIDKAAADAGHLVTVRFHARLRRCCAGADRRGVVRTPLEPAADGIRNWLGGRYSVPAEALLIDRSQLLTLTAPEMTVLVGGL